jgi:hypothetical protein
MKKARVLLYIVAMTAMIFGLIYAFSPAIMPYHERFLGVKHEDLDPRIGKLLLTLMKICGSAFIVIGITLAALVRIPFSRNEKWAEKIIYVIAFGTLLPLLGLTINIGLFTPWWIVALALLLAIAAMILSWSEHTKSS